MSSIFCATSSRWLIALVVLLKFLDRRLGLTDLGIEARQPVPGIGLSAGRRTPSAERRSS